MDVVSGQRESTLRLQRHAVPLMLQATRASPPSSSATPLSSPEQSDTEDTPLPPLPACKLHDAITQLLQRLQALYARSTQRQHQLEDARQQLHELMSGMKALHGWMDESDKKISDPPAVRNHRQLQEQLEQLMVSGHPRFFSIPTLLAKGWDSLCKIIDELVFFPFLFFNLEEIHEK